MLGVEILSTAGSGRRAKRSLLGTGLVGALLVSTGALLATGARPAIADPLSSARAEAAQLNAQIQAEGTRLDVLSNEYDAAQTRVDRLDAQMASIQGQIARDVTQVSTDRNALAAQALTAYMDDASTTAGLDSLFTSDAERMAEAAEYRSVASGNLTTAVDGLRQAQAALGVQEQQLQQTESQARGALEVVNADREAASATQAAERSTLGKVNGQIAGLVAQQQAAQAAAAERAYQARLAAQVSFTGAGTGTSTIRVNIPAAGGAGGAVAAAESRLGDPYVYGGSSPGAFDCSGLSMWAWAQAGISLPRTAAAQYDAVTHIPLSALEPGDLVFWDDGTDSIQHVGIYVGGGEVIHAPSTGSSVRIQPIWGSGLVGAGRP